MSAEDKFRSFAEAHEGDSTICRGLTYGDIRMYFAESKAREEALRAELTEAKRFAREAEDEIEDLRDERDRLKGELAEQSQAAQRRWDMVNDQCQLMDKDRQRILGELTEARRLLAEIDRADDAGNDYEFGEALMKIKASLAAPSPAESTGVHINEAEPEDCPGCIIEHEKYKAQFTPVAPPDDIGKHQRIDRFEAQSNARNIAQHCERLERRIEILEAKAVKCKTCGCTGGNGSWFVTDSRGNVTTTERCPTCRVHSSDCSLDTDHVGKCEHIEHDGVPAAPKPSYNITPALGGIHTAAPQEQAGHAQCGLCGFVAGPNHLCTGAKP